MTRDQIIRAVELFSGKIVSDTKNFLEIEYESIKSKVDIEKMFHKIGVIVLQGSASDIGNKNKIHRIYYLK